MKQTYIKVEETYDVVTDGLILYLDAKDTNSYPGTGTVWYDLSGNGHHAYGDPGAGGAGTNSANFPTYQSTDGGRFYFDGTDGLTITTDMGSHTSLTADFWCYRNSSGGSRYFFDARNDGGTYWLSNYESFNVNIGDMLKANNPTTYNTTSNWWYKWVNMTITVNLSGSALYINGELYTTGLTFDSDLGQYFRIGNRFTGVSINRWVGYWSNIRFYNRVLSSAEIEQNYKAVNGDTNIIWKEVKNVWVNNLGTWVDKVIPKINVSGTWKAAMEYSITATGGDNIYTETISAIDYKIHEFNSSGVFKITDGSGVLDFLIVAGGGGGGVGWGAGGGSGGVVYGSKYLNKGTYSVTIGDGGDGGLNGDQSSVNWVLATKGGDSSFMEYIAKGGGDGGSQTVGGDGGSGGGGTYNETQEGLTNQSLYTNDNDVEEYGYDGGEGQSQVASGRASGSGGGGAGGVGSQSPNYDNGGDGGDGIDFSNIFGTGVGSSGYFAAGGGGGIGNNSLGSPGSGGIGGGGYGGKRNSLNGTNGSNNGSGGGGGGNSGGNGGKGVVIIRYKI